MHLKSNRFLKPLALLVLLALWGGPLPAIETTASNHAKQIMATLSAADQAWIAQQVRAELRKTSSDRAAARSVVKAHFEKFIATRVEEARQKALKANDDFKVQSIEALAVPSAEALVFVALTRMYEQANDDVQATADAIKKATELKAVIHDMIAALADSSSSAAASLLDSERCLVALDTSLQAKNQEAQKQAAAAAADAAESYARVAKVIEQIIAILKG